MNIDSASAVSTKTRPDVILFSIQVFVIVIVVIASLINLTYYKENINLWTMILTSCLGYLMPNPRFKVLKEEKQEVQNSKLDNAGGLSRNTVI
jgi:hypothetical protein